ncbi:MULTISPECIES: hypothetical protein [unclassified Citrobacter]|uniref:hypothetical protein n=1 Tax=unclassified Citrobacter TaxID=2644389 RepID=UPI0015EB00CE|nr:MULTISPECIES: hypothetical protein [unclassified Citrobacter]MBA8057542.1 hypothetical protein [Citrobacter sp. RHBSTW-00104]QLR62047.1 hypothetical protein HV341_08260 [Citrobacter sp. RHBSTW-00976]QLW54527.1 hypothetical protein HV250_08135 [Citrobacter sp. RHBSTW-00628]QLW59415.1 hypothetical protein HV258_08065 [Citrobacter sp. RHBSTW-00667]QLZ25383.1 hypothetical protein HV091_08285 [Citrobacter sp. RHBSTW-00137]
MMKGLVFRNADGDVINIGPWDYMEVPEINETNGEVLFAVKNPLPEGSSFMEEDVVVRDDGGLAAANP